MRYLCTCYLMIWLAERKVCLRCGFQTPTCLRHLILNTRSRRLHQSWKMLKNKTSRAVTPIRVATWENVLYVKCAHRRLRSAFTLETFAFLLKRKTWLIQSAHSKDAKQCLLKHRLICVFFDSALYITFLCKEQTVLAVGSNAIMEVRIDCILDYVFLGNLMKTLF